MFSHPDMLGSDKSTSSEQEENGKKEVVKEKEVEVKVEEQAGGEGMEWHSDGSKGEFTMLMSFEGKEHYDGCSVLSYTLLNCTVLALRRVTLYVLENSISRQHFKLIFIVVVFTYFSFPFQTSFHVLICPYLRFL